ncbi:MAG: NADH-quinone oxidoreductase subunit C, partial [Betaproteobacteria bacterium]
MSEKLQRLQAALQAALGDRVQSMECRLGEVTLTVRAADYPAVCQQLRDDPALGFEQLMDLCGVDYSGYKDGAYDGPRFAVVLHLLSVAHNWRLR